MSLRESMNPKDKILRRFYEPLVLLSVLDPSRDAIKPDHISDRGLNEQAKLWRDFLDQSSFLCDSVKGGDTVTAIAAQNNSEHPVFWLASNSALRGQAQSHYKWILSRLELLCKGSTTEVKTEHEIFRRCVTFSSKRITAYARWLDDAIEEATRQKEGSMTPEDVQLFAKLQELQSYAHDHESLCTFAYTCRSDKAVHILSTRHNAQNHRNVWSDLRHLIGRLGLWTKAVKILIRGAQRFPRYIEHAQVEVIRPEREVDLPKSDYLTNLEGILYRVLPAEKTNTTELLLTALTDLDNMADIWDNVHQRYSNIKPRPHAELLVLEKFHRSELEFINEDHYIGCSKPSCYCCYLYMQCHSGRFLPRPCHGNLWINWAPPIPFPVNSDRRGKSTSRLQDHHTFKMLQQMLVSIRQDLQEQILSRRPRRQKLPDSTTGMSSIAHILQEMNENVTTTLPVTAYSKPASSNGTSMEAEVTDGEDRQSPSVANEDEPTSSSVTRSPTDDAGHQSQLSISSDEDDDVVVFKGRRVGSS